MPNETFPAVVSSSWSELFICVCELQGLIAQTKEVTAVLYKHRTPPLSLLLLCVLWFATEKLLQSWGTYSWAQGYIIGMCGGEIAATIRQMYTEEERGGRKCNGGELKLMMSHYWQAGRTGHQMHRGSSEAGEVGEDKEERGRQVKKRKCVREHCWPLTVKVSGCLFSAPVGADSTRALISH